MLLSLITLYNLTRTYSRINEEYKDKASKYKLDIYALQYSQKGNTTTKVLEIKEGNKENDKIKLPQLKGSSIAHVLLLKDLLGCLLEEVNNFKEAIFIIINIYSL